MSAQAEEGRRSALLLGATGLVGAHCLRLLLDDPAYHRVRVLVRRPAGVSHPRLEEVRAEFDRMHDHPDWFAADDLFCALGTTIRQAGSRAAFRRVDLDYPVEAARLASAAGATHCLVVSALGADAGSRIFYNRVKGEMEREVRALPFEAVWILRPSLLLGERARARPGERLAEALFRPLSPLMVGPLRRLRPIRAETVAAAMVRLARREGPGGVVESDEIERAARG